MEHKIHVAYGFHVNCYHSYRGDTNDENGFGSDIRIIRKIIAALDKLNAEGIPVKGTWDIENFFSLEQILPLYAPDIINSIRRRVKQNGDENIIMGYSNGALGAMQPDELKASIDLAVSNGHGSGLFDLFGKNEMIVRPQEVMFTPSQVKTYKELGVKALCLYYSCVPFDAFRTFIPPLDDEKAFNPLSFSYKGETLTIIPTYSNADVCDAGCLRAWVKSLREKQESGEINRDLFIFINMDADAIFWESLELPLIGNRLANTDGINGLVREVSDLDYVVFDTPGAYLQSHEAIGEISFTQDTADGNFTGYASWAEKPYNRKIWTSVERSRTMMKVRADEDGFLKRIRLLSTTHFGLATPVLNVQREKAADELSAELLSGSVNSKGKLTIYNTSRSTLQCVQLSASKEMTIKVKSQGLEAATVLPMDDSVFLMLRFDRIKDKYEIETAPDCITSGEMNLNSLENGFAKIIFSDDNRIEEFKLGEKTIGEKDFFSSFLKYNGKKYNFSIKRRKSGIIPGGKFIRLDGSITLPGALRRGSFGFTFFTSKAAEGIFVLSDVNYPFTAEKDAISTENSTLGRYTDMKWEEAAPVALNFRSTGDISVIKRNFEGDVSSFRVSSFREAEPRNRTLDSFNNQLSAGIIGLTDGKLGLIVSNNRNFLSSMAYCPMRLNSDGSITMNPFGTFSGKQRRHSNRSNDRIPDTYTLIAPQGKSLAPSYNGVRERALMLLYPFEGKMPDETKFSDITAFADGAYAEGTDGVLSPYKGENVSVKPISNKLENPKIHSPLFGGLRKGNVVKYIVCGFRAVSYIIAKQLKAR